MRSHTSLSFQRVQNADESLPCSIGIEHMTLNDLLGPVQSNNSDSEVCTLCAVTVQLLGRVMNYTTGSLKMFFF